MAINPDSINTVSVGQLPETPFNLTDLLAHEVGSSLNGGTVQNLADLISGYIGASASIAFRPETVADGGILPNTSTEEWMLVGQGTFTNVGGGANITTTEELNALISNGIYWSIGVEIPINVELAGITQLIRSGFTNTTPSEDAVFNALATKVDAADVVDPGRLLNINGDIQDLSANREWRTAQADTGVLTFAGLTTNSSTTINIGAVVGVVVDNETTPTVPVYTTVNYAGATGVTVTTIGSGTASYVMLSSTGVISFQNTFPTSAERKAKIWLGKVSHPSGSVTIVVNEPDYITSPMSFSRDIVQGLGGYINDGVYPYENGANLQMNITGGNIHGDGINFVNDRTKPNELAMGPSTAVTFSERTQTGGVTAGVTSVSVGFYDVAGTVTAIPGPGATSTLRYIFAVPGQGYIIQYGQTTYSSLSNAIAAIGKESFVKWSNLNNNAILIGVLAARKDATSLRTADGQAQFFFADKLGGLIGSSAGTSIATLQSAYNNSLVPQIVTSTSLGAVTIQRGSAADTDAVLIGKNGSGTTTSSIKGNGTLLINSSTDNGVDKLQVNGSGIFTINDTSGALKVRNARASDASNIQEWKNIAGTTTASIDGNGKITASVDASINGLTVGLATGNVATNTALSLEGLLLNSSGSNNTVVGYKNLRQNSTGASNTALGSQALLLSQTSSFNTAIGASALSAITSGTNNDNVSVGYLSFGSLGSGSSNTALGSQAGRLLNNKVTGIGSANNSLFLGYRTSALAAAGTNETVIGHDASGNGSDTVTIGNSSVTGNYFFGSLNMRNVANTFFSGFTNTNTASRTYTLPDASGTVALTSDFTSASYTPTFTNTANVSGFTFVSANYMRVGNIVNVSINLEIDATTDSTTTVFKATLPIARATSTAKNAGTGTALYYDGTYSTFALSTQLQSTTEASILFTPVGTTNPHICSITFQYSVLD